VINKFKLEIPYIISKFKKHKEIKHKLLTLIDESQANNILDSNQEIRTDFHITNVRKKYFEFAQPILNEHMIKVFESLNHEDPVVRNFWFQQYKKNGKHGWHQHRGISWSNVYYVELGKDAPKTVFKNPINNQETIVPEVEEGDILTMPGVIWHCSEPNMSDCRKTVYVFNVW
jgi:hypothetical protein